MGMEDSIHKIRRVDSRIGGILVTVLHSVSFVRSILCLSNVNKEGFKLVVNIIKYLNSKIIIYIYV